MPDENDEVTQNEETNQSDLQESSIDLATAINEAETAEEIVEELEVEEDEQLPSTEDVDRFLKRNNMTALPASEYMKLIEPKEEAKKEPEADGIDYDHLEFLRETNPEEYHKQVISLATERTSKAINQTIEIRAELIEDIRREVPELDEQEISIIQQQLNSVSSEQLLQAKATRAHIVNAQAYIYQKRKAGATMPKKNPARDPKNTTRPEAKAAVKPEATERDQLEQKVHDRIAKNLGITPEEYSKVGS